MRRNSLPGAAELFRVTGPSAVTPLSAAPSARSAEIRPRPDDDPPPRKRRSSGRERHDEKITVYISSSELLELESARLKIRGEHGLAVDRGRVVREAIAIALADFEAYGPHSRIVRRLLAESEAQKRAGEANG